MRRALPLSAILGLTLLAACGGGGGGSQESGASSTTTPSPTDYWAKHMGGAKDDAGYLAVPYAGGVFLVGTTHSFGAGGRDAWILKASSSGSIQAQVAIGGAGDDDISDARPTADGGFILAGSTTSFGVSAGTTQGWLVKLNADLTVAWEERFAPASPATGARFNTVVPIGTQFVALGAQTDGKADSALMVVVAANGSIQAQRTLGARFGTRIISAAVSPDQGLFIGGEVMVDDSLPPGGAPYPACWYARLAPDLLTFDFSRYFFAPYNTTCSVLRGTTDGGVVLAGSWAGVGFLDCWIAKVDPSTGIPVWINGIGGGSGWNTAMDLLETPDKGFLLTASTTGTFDAGGTDLWLVRMAADGNVQWQKTYGTSGEEGIGGAASWIDPGSQSIFALSALKTSASGQELWLLKAKPDGSCPPFARTSTGVVYASGASPLGLAPTAVAVSGQFFPTNLARTTTTATLQ